MAESVEVDVFDLEGAALDWAVAKAFGASLENPAPHSTEWGHGGPLLEREGVKLERDLEGYSEPNRRWCAEHRVFWANGATMLVAGCRVLVMSKLNCRSLVIPTGLMGS